MPRQQPRIVIVGAGFGGIAAAIELQARGFTDLTILERGPGIGGTWLYNDYPGSACDVPSHLYSYSFAQRRDWTRLCSPQAEILDYLRGVAHDYGVDRYLVTDVEVERCEWDTDAAAWRVSAGDRSWEAEALVIATGQLHRHAYPGIAGRERFAGHSFHSANWDHDYDIADKRVAVVGTGASAVQFVPEIAPRARELIVFQRTGNWFLPRRNRAYPGPVRALIERLPGLQALRRRFVFDYGESLTMMIRHPAGFGRLGRLRSSLFMRWQLRGDPGLRSRVWPDYTFGCKRVLFSSYWLPALRRPDVQLVTEPVAEITPAGPRTADGAVHEVDCIVWGTGFRTTDFMFPMEIVGAGGERLAEAWADGPRAHLGMTVPGFPSLFLMYGPNTNTSGGSIIFYLERQAAYIRQALQRVRDAGAEAIEVRREVAERFDRETQARFRGTAWERCESWYRDESGRIVANWPGYMREYAELTERLDPGEYELLGAGDRVRRRTAGGRAE